MNKIELADTWAIILAYIQAMWSYQWRQIEDKLMSLTYPPHFERRYEGYNLGFSWARSLELRAEEELRPKMEILVKSVEGLKDGIYLMDQEFVKAQLPGLLKGFNDNILHNKINNMADTNTPKLYQVLDSDDKEEFFTGTEEQVKDWLFKRYHEPSNGEFVIEPVEEEPKVQPYLEVIPQWFKDIPLKNLFALAADLNQHYFQDDDIHPINYWEDWKIDEFQQNLWRAIDGAKSGLVEEYANTFNAECFIAGYRMGLKNFTGDSRIDADQENADMYEYFIESIIKKRAGI